MNNIKLNMESNIKYNSKTHNHREQLGDLINLCDDVLSVVSDFLPNKDVFNMGVLANSYLYKLLIHRRYCAFKKKRREKMEKIISMRDKDNQFANKVFKWDKCVVAECEHKRARLTHFTDDIYRIPYCSVCWEFKILPMFT